ncbi:E3 SUMO-ligase MMS21 [Micractinium conductrix]|uniref:E3 SUMO-ligase MMS21 n=1 Tax=Micractinium conductrix TaxID=554055 RepID=A0A2P6V1C9_9CHLO|nr:E3 SUMO-ligase MMS21 [Micractinium conductrix]|eukprot:PSC67899.1 E3 SUMO-ligase MMS21 [Micractinium conductrix]
MDGVDYSSQPVLQGIESHLTQQRQAVKQCEAVVETLGDVATMLASSSADPQQLEELRAAVKRVLEARHGAELHGAVLQELKGSYAAGPGGTDFGAAISGRSTALAEATPYDARQDPLYQEFERAAGGDGDDEPAGMERIDDDIEIEGGGALLAPNERCPVSNKLLLELDDPVQDSTGVVYERAAVQQFFRTLPPHKHGRAIIMAGSTHQVTYGELVPADKVIREKRRAARRQQLVGRGGGGGGGGDGGGADEDVLDV